MNLSYALPTISECKDTSEKIDLLEAYVSTLFVLDYLFTAISYSCEITTIWGIKNAQKNIL